MLRRILATMTESAAKRIKTSGAPLIGTHSGHFHADEALAVHMLRMLPTYKDASLVRTRDPKILETCHTVVDVGGEYDAARNRFDHHQRGFTTTFPGKATKLSSAGLVFLHFGRSIIAQKLGVPADQESSHTEVGLLHSKLYDSFVEALDAHDNGISVYDPAAISAAGIDKRYSEGVHPRRHGRPLQPQLERPCPLGPRRGPGRRGRALPRRQRPHRRGV
uniref:MYG1 protein n=1 Tax=Bionectria ochroleuca TaxID=29856 RepID=A0A8H7K824_BIOOC